jgi:hypothetical protein
VDAAVQCTLPTEVLREGAMVVVPPLLPAPRNEGGGGDGPDPSTPPQKQTKFGAGTSTANSGVRVAHLAAQRLRRFDAAATHPQLEAGLDRVPKELRLLRELETEARALQASLPK